MKRTASFALGLALLAISASQSHAATRSGQLETVVPASAPANAETRSGVIQLAGGAYAYLPPNRATPSPVLIALHGAGGEASDILEGFKPGADAHGVVLVIPRSIKGTWDMVEDLKSRLGAEMNVQPRYGKDLEAIDRSLADLFTRVPVDRSRIGIMGFSDGASYALSVGTANPQLFSTVMAFSPGHSFPAKFDKRQRVFVSHGDKDQVLPFANARSLVARMRGRGMTVHFEPFEGRHEVPKAIREKAVAFFMDTGSTP